MVYSSEDGQIRSFRKRKYKILSSNTVLEFQKLLRIST